MKVSYKWLQEYFEDKLPEPKVLEEILITKSFEVEEVVENGEDYIFDIDVLPNRAHDCLSHEGLAMEISAVTGAKLKTENIYSYDLKGQNNFNLDNYNQALLETDLQIEIQEAKVTKPIEQANFKAPAKDFCPRYLGCVIENVEIGPSPKELKDKIESIGEKSINNLVDITNIVMFACGQPMHAFDKDKITGNTIYVRSAKESEHIELLSKEKVDDLEKERLAVLNADDHVIADQESALAIAGVKGGKRAEVTNQTKNIILESANFHSTSIRKTSRKYNALTESSKRYENEITPWLTEKAMMMAIDLVKKYASNKETKIYKIVDKNLKPVRNYISGFSLESANRILGAQYTKSQITEALDSLSFRYTVLDNPTKSLIDEAKLLIGKPYKYGTSVSFDAPNFFDCSTFTAYLFSKIGISLPRLTIDQLFFGEEVAIDDALPGDLIFGNSEKEFIRYETVNFLPGQKFPQGVDHVGIYLGDNKIIHASRHNPNGGVEITNIQDHVDYKNIVGVRRYIKQDEVRFAIEVPMTRLDLKNEFDFAEEVGRILGYDKIQDQEMTMGDFQPKIHKYYLFNNLIRKALIEEGFSEVITYSFVKEGEIAPQNPIAEDKAFLRKNLQLGFEEALEKNLINIDWLLLDQIKIFEIGSVFSHEKEGVVLGLGVKNKNGFKKVKPADSIKNALQKIEQVLNKKINIEIKENDYFIEIDLDDLYQDLTPTSNYPQIDTNSSDVNFKSISIYPFMIRDIAVWLNEKDDPDKLINIIKSNLGDLLIKEPKLFDTFSKEGRTSYAFRLVLQSQTKTLTDQEVNESMAKINSEITACGWEVR